MHSISRPNMARFFGDMSGQFEGSITRSIRYFVEAGDKIKKSQINRLAETRMFSALSDGGERYRAKDLFEPSKDNIALGLRVLNSPESLWESRSREAQFIFRLGLIEVRYVYD